MRIVGKFIMIGLLLGLAACSDWLNVSPDDQVNEETLFTDGDGYRNALNGIYKDLADFALYGRELTWGMNEVLGQTYHLNYIPSDHAYYYMAWSMYDNDKVEAILSSLWEQAYNAIANCNNLISHIAHADATLFSGKDMELNMIYGEALALRAFIHLDLLRLFAPAPVVADHKKYIPYMEDYGTVFADRESVKDCMNKIIRDLKQAKKLLSEVDIIPENRIWSKTYYRIEGGRGVVDDNLPRDIFYMYRGYRMNYWATTAILARAYMYDGQQALAREQAQEVIEATYEENGRTYNCFSFTSPGDYGVNPKLYDGVICGFSKSKVSEEYANWQKGTGGLYLCSYLTGMDAEDWRKDLFRTVNWFYSISVKYDEDNGDTYGSDLLPVIRLSEMYYIVSEYLYKNGDTEGGVQKLDEVRMERGIAGGKLDIRSVDDFEKALLADMRKDFYGEGQVFYQFKRLNRELSSNNKTEFVLPIPKIELIY